MMSTPTLPMDRGDFHGQGQCDYGIMAEITPTPSPSPLSLPLPPKPLRKLVLSRILALSSCLSVFLISSYLIFLIGQMITLTFWSLFLYRLSHSTPKTFAWTVVIEFFGATLSPDKDCDRDPDLIDKGSSHSVPFAPLTGLILQVLSLSCSIFLIGEKIVFGPSSSLGLKGLLISLIFHLIFAFWTFIYSLIHFSGESFEKEFEILMRSNLKVLNQRWKITQAAHHCCGVNNFTDWVPVMTPLFLGGGDLRYPKTCCDPQISACQLYPNRTQVFQNGCLLPELELVNSLTTTNLGFTLSSLLLGMLIFSIAWIVHSLHSKNDNLIFRLSKHPRSGFEGIEEEETPSTVERRTVTYMTLNRWGFAWRTESTITYPPIKKSDKVDEPTQRIKIWKRSAI